MTDADVQLKHLFSPFQIGHMELRNRIMLPPHGMPVGNIWGSVEEARQNVAYWASRAQDGAAWIGGFNGFVDTTLIPGFLPTGVGARAKGVFRTPLFADRAAMYADAIHDAGAFATLQLIMQGGKPHGASERMANYTDSTVPHVLTGDEIRWLVDEYAFSAAATEAAGMDGLELHANHEDVLQLFLSPLTNRRDDEYGGDFERRLRYVTDILAAIDANTSDRFTVGVRFNLDEFFEGGYGIDEGIRIMQALAATGHVHYFHGVVGNNWGAPSYLQPHHYGVAEWSALASRYREALDIPVVYAGRVSDPVAADKLIAQGHADVVGIARSMFADRHLISKARAGRAADIRPCIGCNECLHARIVENLPFHCPVSPETGRESAPPPTRVTGRSLAIAGGGPAGLELAAVAAERGFTVTLFERDEVLGGQLRVAANIRENAAFLGYLDHQHKRLQALGVHLHLGAEASAQTLIDSGADTIAVATGARPHVPDIPGSTQQNVTTAYDVMRGSYTCGARVVVIAGEDHLQPLNVASYLVEQGRAVRLIYQTPAVAPLVGKYSIGAVMAKLSRGGVEVRVMQRLVRIEPHTLTLADIYSGVEHPLTDFDTVVLACGGRAENALHQALQGRAENLHLVGDAYAPRRLWFATRTAHELALRL